MQSRTLGNARPLVASGLAILGLIAAAAPCAADVPGEGKSPSQVLLAIDGLLPGRVSVVDPVSGAIRPAQHMEMLFVRDGEVVSAAKAGPDGVFQVAGLRPAVYSVLMSGPAGFAAFGLSVLPAAPADGDGAAGSTGRPRFDVLAVPTYDLPAVRAMAATLTRPAGFLPPAPAAPGLMPVPQSAPLFGPADGPVSFQPEGAEANRDGEPGRGGDALPAAPQPVPVPDAAEPVGIPVRLESEIPLGADDALTIEVTDIDPATGLIAPLTEAAVVLVRGGSVVARGTTNGEGLVRFEGVRAGVFSFVVASPKGFAAIGLDLEQGDALSGAASDHEDGFVAHLNKPVKVNLVISVIKPWAFGFLPGGFGGFCCQGLGGPCGGGGPFGGGGGGGGAGGGGGGGLGGGGLLGALAGAGVGAGIGAALSNRNRNGNNPAATPAVVPAGTSN